MATPSKNSDSPGGKVSFEESTSLHRVIQDPASADSWFQILQMQWHLTALLEPSVIQDEVSAYTCILGTSIFIYCCVP